MEAVAIVPWAGGDPWREKLWRFTRSYLQSFGLRVVTGTADNTGGPSRFNHPQAINEAVAGVFADVLVLCDADTLPGIDLREAIHRVGTGVYPWAMPEKYAKLSRKATERTLRRGLFYSEQDADWIGERVSWAGVQIVRRRDFLAVHGWDERFIGWGSDDTCFGLAMDTLVGQHQRVGGTAVHLWHEQTPADSYEHPNWQAQQELTARYRAAVCKPWEMRALITEAR